MRKNKLKNYLKFGILLFGISLLFINCQKDDEFSPNTNQNKSNLKLNKISLKDLQQKQNIQQSLKKLSKNFDVNKNKSNQDGSLSKIISNDSTFTILTEEIIQVTTDSTETFTFQIETPTLESSAFENFVLEVKNDTIYKYYITRYQNTDDQSQEFPYSFSIQIINENLLNLDDLYSQIQNKVLSYISGNCIYTFESVGCECIGYETFVLIDTYCSSGGGGSASAGNGDGGTPFGTGVGNTTGGGTQSPNNTGTTNGNDDDDIEIPVLALNEPSTLQCQQIAAQMANTDFLARMQTLKDNYGEQAEVGFSQNSDGSFTPLPLNENGHTLDIPIFPTTLGYLHSHQNDYETGEFDEEGNPREKRPIKIHSPKDVLSFLDIVLNANTNGIPLSEVYGTVVASTGIYTIRFDGDVNDVLANILDIRARIWSDRYIDLVYKPYFDEYGNKERAFLNWLKDEIGIDGVSLFWIKQNGMAVKAKTLKENGRVQTDNCRQ